MGATKLLTERLTISANLYKGRRKTAFSCVRFGNVLDSRGSIVPIFKKQIAGGGPVTITDTRMTRFIMTIPNAVELILKSAKMAEGGEIFILKMLALRIVDLAKAMIYELAPKYGYDPGEIDLEIIGKRPGEKIYEELITDNEMAYVQELEDMLVISSHESKNGIKNYKNKHISKDVKLMTFEEIQNMLREIL